MEARKNSSRVYDLWSGEQPHSFNEKNLEGALPKKQKYIPTLLPKVELPSAGTSYNPSLKSYINYVNKLAKNEAKLLSRERREKKVLELTAEEASLYPAFKEDTSFFLISATSLKEDVDKIENVIEIKEDEADLKQTSEINDLGEVKDEPIEVVETDIALNANSVPKKVKQKTIKQRRRQTANKAATKLQDLNKIQKNLKHQLENLKSIEREVKKTLKKHEEKVMKRKNKRLILSLTKRKKLGRGRFEKFLEPALMTNELTGSLRKLPNHCDILAERFNSLQKRNLIPIAGERPKKLKQKLKIRDVEKRSVKDVTKDSRVI